MQALSRQDLLALLNWELCAYDECDGCHFTSIRPMRANGFDARVQADHPLGVEEQFIVRRVVEETRRRFELAAR